METNSSALNLETDKKCFLCCNDFPIISIPNGNKISVDSDGVTSSFDDVGIKTEILEEQEVTVDSDIYVNQEDQPLQEYSLLAICRYLKLNLKEILKDCGNFEEENQFPTVNLCGKCGELVEQLTELCRELEVIKMKVEDKLHTFGTYLEMNTVQDWETGNHCQLITSLRNRIQMSCKTKLNDLLPRVQINACDLSQPTEEIVPTVSNAKEQVVVKMDCGEINVDEGEPTVNSSMSNLPIFGNDLSHDLTHQKLCILCGKWINKHSFFRHRNKDCRNKPASNNMILLETEEIQHECEICHRKFNSSTNLLKHIRILHVSESVAISTNLAADAIKCEQCGRTLHKRNIKRHLERHCPSTKVDNNIPTTDPLGESELKRQLQIQEKRQEKGQEFIKCDLCGKIILKKNMSKHKRIVCKFGPRLTQSSYNEKRTCEICGQEYQHRASYWRHKKIAHSNSQTVKTSSGGPSLEQIQSSFSVDINGKVKCSKCGAVISKKSKYRHRNFTCPFGPKLSNPQSKPRACDICGKIYYNWPSMYRHKAKAHPEHRNILKISQQADPSIVKSDTATETDSIADSVIVGV